MPENAADDASILQDGQVTALTLATSGRGQRSTSDLVAEVDPRGRNRVALEGEFAAWADLGARVRLVAADGWDLPAAAVAALAERRGVRLDPVRTTPRPEPVLLPVAADPLHANCPKHLSYGPCGGVHDDGGCEVGGRPCDFVGAPASATVAPWTGVSAPLTAAAQDLAAILARRPLIASSHPAAAMSRDSILTCADLMRDAVDVQLAGDAGTSRTQFPPAYRARLMTEAGIRTWSGVHCRDRDQAALVRELVSLREVGVAGVHCITGDHPALGTRNDATGVFALEGTTVIGHARTAGHLVSFAETPAAPPTGLRAERVALKVTAGGQICLPQYAGDVANTQRFIDDVEAAVGRSVPVLAGVPLILSQAGARLMESFATARMPAGYVDRIASADAPARAGVRAAIELGEALLALPGVTGVVVAGGVDDGAEPELARAMATVCAALGGGG